MQKIIKREIENSIQPYFHSGLRYLSAFEISKTSQDNFDELTGNRIGLLELDRSNDDLTKEEIADVEEYKSGSGVIKKFKNVKEFLKDLND